MNVGQRMTISEVAGEPVTLVVAGEIDAYSSPALERALGLAARSDVRIDMSAVSFMDSTGLRALVRADHLARRDGRVVSIVSPSMSVLRLLELTALDERLHIAPPGEEQRTVR